MAQDPTYITQTPPNPTLPFWASLNQYTHYRPSLDKYATVTVIIQTTTESVATGQETPSQAVDDYASQLTSAVGATKVERH